jgi:nitroreductase
VQDATIACAYAQLAAQEEGLGCVWVGAFDEKAVAKAVRAGEGMKPIAILPLGYAAETPFPTKRRKMEDCFVREEF